MTIPHIALATGQVEKLLWYSRLTAPETTGNSVRFPGPSPKFRARLNYLREMDVPFDKRDRSPGTGTNLVYDFHHLSELAVAFELLDRGARPQNVADLIVAKRTFIRVKCEHAYIHRDDQFDFVDPHRIGFGYHLAIDIRYVIDKPYLGEIKYLNSIDAAFHAIAGDHSRLLIPISVVISNLVEAALELAPERRGRKRNDR